MAKSKNIKKSSSKNTNHNSNSKRFEIVQNKENLKFFVAILLIAIGGFLTLSIISYFSTWREDQSAIMSSSNLWNYIFGDSIANNWAGKLGAALSHSLVYSGIGIMAILFSAWIIASGINLLYNKRIIRTNKWLRWMALGFLFLCPFISLLFSSSKANYGGVFGHTLIEWSNGVAGLPGSIFMLILVFSFFAIMVFKWDLKPWLSKIKFSVKSPDVDLESEIKTSSNFNQNNSEPDYGQSGVSPIKKENTTFDASVYINEMDAATDEDILLLPKNENTYTELNDNKIPVVDIESSHTEDPQLQISMNEIPEINNAHEFDSENRIENPFPPEEVLQESNKLKYIDEVVDENTITDPNIKPLKDNSEDTQEVPFIIHKNGIVVEFPETQNATSQENSLYENIHENSEELNPVPNDAMHEFTVVEKDPSSITEINTQDDKGGINNWVVVAANEDEKPQLTGSDSVAKLEPYAPELDLRDYKFPILDLLEDLPVENIALNAEELAKNKEQITNTLRSFGIEISKIQATVGPTVTLYEIVPQEGVRISKIRNLEDDIALNLAALGIRMIAPIPGRGTIGIEVPNAKKQIVPMRSLLSSDKFINNEMSLPIALGKKIDNENYIVDLASMPHLLMAGATGQGKSVGINAILVSLLYKKHPSQLKFVMVDPKKVELSVYRTIEKHYLAKLPNEEEAIITDTKKVINTLNSLCIEMDNRYELLKDAGTRNIKEYNAKFIQRKLNPERGHKYLPFIVLIIDEFADLIMTAGKEVEMPVARLAQLARAVGIHLIVATQRPSVNVITGIIKANFPARIAFRVTSKVDSRTILDTGGADQLIGRGDMLVSHGSELLRLQCAFVDTPEVERIVEYIGDQRGYPTAFELPEYEGAEDEANEKKDVDLSKRDKMFEECARLVVNSQSGSTSMLQRKFNLGYNRAGRIMDQLEAAGIVGAQSGSKPRDVLVSSEYELESILETLL